MKLYNSKHISLLLFMLLLVLFGSNQSLAQTDEEDQNTEESDGFFNDMSSSRFNSSYESSGSKNQIDYNYRDNNNYNNNRDENYNNNSPVNDLDIEVHHKTYDGGVQVIGGGGGGNYTNNNTSNGSPSTGIPGIVNPEVKVKNPIDNAFPDNPGDPDAPLDGGIGLLLAAGLGYGAWKKKNQKV